MREILAQTLPVSLTLGSLAFLVACTAGVWLGTFAAVRHNGPFDAGAMFAALLAISVPTFVTGPLCILVFAVKWGVLPVGGWGTAASVVLPALVLAAPYVAYIARLMRFQHVGGSGAGLYPHRPCQGAVRKRRCLPPRAEGSYPAGGQLRPDRWRRNLLTGSLVVESIFNIPGMGGFFRQRHPQPRRLLARRGGHRVLPVVGRAQLRHRRGAQGAGTRECS